MDMDKLRETLAAATPGPWKLIRWGNEKLPAPLSIHTADDECWITRGGTVARESDAALIALAPSLAADLLALTEDHARLKAAAEDAR